MVRLLIILHKHPSRAIECWLGTLVHWIAGFSEKHTPAPRLMACERGGVQGAETGAHMKADILRANELATVASRPGGRQWGTRTGQKDLTIPQGKETQKHTKAAGAGVSEGTSCIIK